MWPAGSLNRAAALRSRVELGGSAAQVQLSRRQVYAAWRGGEAHAERFLLPFTERQRDEYIKQRVAADEKKKEKERELPPTEAYERALAGRSSSVRELVRNPFVLRLFARRNAQLIHVCCEPPSACSSSCRPR